MKKPVAQAFQPAPGTAEGGCPTYRQELFEDRTVLSLQIRQRPGGKVQGRVQFQGLLEHVGGFLAVAQALQIDPQVGVVDG